MDIHIRICDSGDFSMVKEATLISKGFDTSLQLHYASTFSKAIFSLSKLEQNLFQVFCEYLGDDLYFIGKFFYEIEKIRLNLLIKMLDSTMYEPSTCWC